MHRVSRKGRVVGHAAIRFLRIFGCVVIVLATVLPFLNGPTETDPYGGADTFAPLLALISSLMWITTLHRTKPHKVTYGIMLCGPVASAYFWMATASESHPRSVEFLVGLGLLFGILLGITCLLLLTWGWLLFAGMGKDDEED